MLGPMMRALPVAILLPTECPVTIGVALVAMVSRHYSREGSRQTQTLTGQFLPGLVTLSRLQAAAPAPKAPADTRPSPAIRSWTAHA